MASRDVTPTRTRDHHRSKDAQINIRCTIEERMRIVSGAAKSYELQPPLGEYGWRRPFSFAQWAIDTLTAAANAALGPKPKPKAKPKKKKTAKKKARRR